MCKLGATGEDKKLDGRSFQKIAFRLDNGHDFSGRLEYR